MCKAGISDALSDLVPHMPTHCRTLLVTLTSPPDVASLCRKLTPNRHDGVFDTSAAGGSGGTFVYLSSSPNGITDTSGTPTLLLVAARLLPSPPASSSSSRNPLHAPPDCAALLSLWRPISVPLDRDFAPIWRTYSVGG